MKAPAGIRPTHADGSSRRVSLRPIPASRYNAVMNQTGGALRPALATLWCLLFFVGYLLSQLSALQGTDLSSETERLGWVYLVFLILFAAAMIREAMRPSLQLVSDLEDSQNSLPS